MRRIRFPVVILAAWFFVTAPFIAFPADQSVEKYLPPSCAKGWSMEGRVATYDRENLYKYIDGEAELYLPYGFSRAATAMYAKPGNKDQGVVVNIFEMGSLLDAFGIYSNYRSTSAHLINVGAEGFADESQLMFYQGRYFIQIMASGALTHERPLFLSCASEISRRLPPGKGKPAELEFLKIPGSVPASEKYYAEALPGQAFFGRGLTAEVMFKEKRLKSVVMLADSEEDVKRLFDAYAAYLKKAGATYRLSGDKKGVSLQARDPLYKNIQLQQSGCYVAGIIGLPDPSDARFVVEDLIKRLPKK
jgi:hypothetical protein